MRFVVDGETDMILCCHLGSPEAPEMFQIPTIDQGPVDNTCALHSITMREKRPE